MTPFHPHDPDPLRDGCPSVHPFQPPPSGKKDRLRGAEWNTIGAVLLLLVIGAVPKKIVALMVAAVALCAVVGVYGIRRKTILGGLTSRS